MACGADKKWVSLRKRHTGGARRTGPQHGGLPPPPRPLRTFFSSQLTSSGGRTGPSRGCFSFRTWSTSFPFLLRREGEPGPCQRAKTKQGVPSRLRFGNSLGPTPLGDLRGTKDSGPKGRDRKRAASPWHGGEARMDARLFRGTAAPRRPAPLSSRVGPTATLMGVVGDQPSWVWVWAETLKKSSHRIFGERRIAAATQANQGEEDEGEPGRLGKRWLSAEVPSGVGWTGPRESKC